MTEILRLFAAYLSGCLVVGLPMAMASLWFYRTGEEFDHHPRYKFLKLIRNFIYPRSFVLIPLNEDSPRRNYHISYEGPIGDLLGDGDIESRLFYVLLVTLLWPVRLGYSVVVWTLILGFFGVCYLVASSFGFLFWICKKIALMVEKEKVSHHA